MTNAFRRTAERRNKRVWLPLSPTEMSAKRVSFRLIAPLDEKLTAYLAKKWTFATPRPMGKHIIAKTGNIAAVQQQLGHRQAAYAMQYARTTTEELERVLDDR